MTIPHQAMPKNALRQEIRPLFMLMLPIVITQFAQVGVGFIDTVMSGRLSANDLAATGVAVGVWAPVMLFFVGVLLATTPLIAKARGEKNFDEVVKVAQNAQVLALGLGLVGFLFLQCLPWLLPVLQVPQTLIPKATLYIRMVAFGMPAVTLYAALRAYSESLGFARPVTVIALLALPVMVPVNYAFMYGFGIIPKMAGPGAGVATAIIQWLSLLALLLYVCFSKKYQHAPLFVRWHGIDRQKIVKIIRLGLPIGLSIFFEVAIFSTAGIVISPLGDLVVAAHQVTLSITSMLFMIPMALAMALTIRVGVHYGERDKVALQAVQKLGFLVATVLACMTMAVLWVWREPIVGIYTQDTQVMAYAVHLVLFAVAYQLVDAWQVCAAGCLRGVQETKAPMWIMLFVYWGVAFPLGFYLVRVLNVGAWGIWAGFIVGLTLASILLVMKLRQVNRHLPF